MKIVYPVFVRLFQTISLILVCQISFAKSVDFEFSHYQTENGLPHNNVNAIIQDSYGFIWFATDLGLSKFDGYSITNYNNIPGDTLSLSSNLLFSICEGNDGNLWIGTLSNGLNLFDREKETFRHFVYNSLDSTSISSDQIYAIYKAKNGFIWVGTTNGINRIDPVTFAIKRYSFEKVFGANIPIKFINSIVEDHNSNLWLSSSEGVLIKFNPSSGESTTIPVFDKLKGQTSNLAYSKIYLDEADVIWFGGSGQLVNYDIHTQKTSYVANLPQNIIENRTPFTSIVKFNQTELLIGTDHGGLLKYNKQSKTFTQYQNDKNNPRSLYNDQVYCILLDRDGQIWTGHFSGGVNKMNGGLKFLPTNSNTTSLLYYDYSVLGFCESPDGNLYFATDGNGIKKLNLSSFEVSRADFQTPQIGDVVVDLMLDEVGDIWIGTYLKGLFRYSPKSKIMTSWVYDYKNKRRSISGNSVWTFCNDKGNRKWIGTVGTGVNVYNDLTNSFVQFEHNEKDTTSIVSDVVLKIAQDSDGLFWFGTIKGLDMYDPKMNVFKHFSPQLNQKSPCGSTIFEIFVDSHKQMWIGTDVGLNYYDKATGEFTCYSEKDGLVGATVLGILEDGKGNLWMSTNKGINCFNPVTKHFSNYSVADGLQANEFNYTSCIKLKDGRMAFGGIKGFNLFHPDSIRNNTTVPPLYFTGLQVLNKPVSVCDSNSVLTKSINLTDTIILNSKQNIFTISFVSLNHVIPSKNKYSYYLEGFDLNWVEPSFKREVTYTNLNYGTYKLHIKGSNNDGLWNEKGKTLTIIILPPWYRTIWFYLALFVFFILILYSYILYREKKFILDNIVLQAKVLERTKLIEEQKNLLEEQKIAIELHQVTLQKEVENRTIELKWAKEKAEDSDRLKSAFLANMSHEIRTPLNAIVGFSNLLSEEETAKEDRLDYINIIQQNSSSLLLLISDILDISLIEANQLNIKLVPFELNSFLNTIEENMRVVYKKENLTFTLKNWLCDDDLTLCSDRNRITQIINNLLSNSFKFTDSGYIQLTVIRSDDSIVFSVSDSGIGISEHDLEYVFDRFKKFATSSERVYGGTGLGLAISKKLSELLGGRMWVESEIGKGSTFYFSLPASVAIR